ncbi:hypothetical protein POPTR_001G172000v4 [Populus trichocarpa]|jgi:hypothetical protein|uniref:Uncharacterized protein n=1 Tax=Populus trichocarpa TaxID=3694 RepID=A0ACC0TJN2_POPTR|nr:hypothetical protein POPTR_001G172000v4 [Populus trichocarpa]
MVFLLKIKLQRKAKSKPHQGHYNPSACEYLGTKRQDCLYMIVCTYYLETLDAKWDALKAFEHHKLTQGAWPFLLALPDMADMQGVFYTQGVVML